jgi:ATP-binding cassette subfamily C protein CydC
MKESTLRRLLKLASPYRWWMLLSAVLGFATVGSSVGLMSTSAYIIAKAALHPNIGELQVAIVGVRFFGISRGVFRYAERLVSHNTTFKLLARLRVWFYESLEPLAPARLMEYRSGDLLTRIVGDIESLENFFVRVIAPPLVAVITTAVVWLLLTMYGLRVADTLMVFLVVAGIGIPMIARAIGRRAGKELITRRADLNTHIVDGIQGLPDLLAYGRGERQKLLVSQSSRALIERQQKMAMVTAIQDALGALMAGFGMLAVTVVAIPLVTSGAITGVDLAVIALAALSSFEAVQPLPLAAQYLENNLEAARRLFEIVDATPEVVDPDSPEPLPTRHGISVSGLRFEYPGSGTPALDGIDFNVREGGRIAIVGPSGAGKSTLVQLLLRFWEYHSGRIEIGGKEIRSYRQDDLRKMIGVVSQSTYLFNATVRENLLLARPDATDEEIFEAAKRAQIHEFILSLPDGYDTWVGEQGVGLSGGERQRLAIARALLKDAPILVLDEATANLDAVTERKVLEAIRKLMEGRTTLMITHRLVGMEWMNEILVLSHGRIVERGTHQSLLQSGGFYKRMWDLQNQVLPAELAA